MAGKKSGAVCCILLSFVHSIVFQLLVVLCCHVSSSLSLRLSLPLSLSLSHSGFSQLHCIPLHLSLTRGVTVCVCVLCALLSVVVLSYEEVIRCISVNQECIIIHSWCQSIVGLGYVRSLIPSPGCRHILNKCSEGTMTIVYTCAPQIPIR